MFNNSRSPKAKLWAEIEARNKNRARAAKDRDAARALISSLQLESVKAAVAGGERPEVTEKRSAKLTAAERTVISFTDAIKQIDDEVAKLTAEYNVLVEHRQRAETDGYLSHGVEEAETVVGELVAVLGRTANSFSRLAPAAPEAAGMVNFATSSSTLVLEALDQVKRLVSDYRRGVAAGALPAKLGCHETVEPISETPHPEVAGVIARQNIAWTDDAGAFRMSQKGYIAALPPALVEEALKSRAVVHLGSSEGSKLHAERRPLERLRLSDCRTLDSSSSEAKEAELAKNHSVNPIAKADEPTQSTNSVFEQLDRGASYSMRLPVEAA